MYIDDEILTFVKNGVEQIKNVSVAIIGCLDATIDVNAMGANISGAGKSVLVVEGVKKLHGIEYTPIEDRIETGTFLIAAAVRVVKYNFSTVKLKIFYLL